MPQRDTRSYHIDEANRLSKLIDAATSRPTDLIRQFEYHVRWLEKHVPDLVISDHVLIHQQW